MRPEHTQASVTINTMNLPRLPTSKRRSEKNSHNLRDITARTLGKELFKGLSNFRKALKEYSCCCFRARSTIERPTIERPTIERPTIERLKLETREALLITDSDHSGRAYRLVQARLAMGEVIPRNFDVLENRILDGDFQHARNIASHRRALNLI